MPGEINFDTVAFRLICLSTVAPNHSDVREEMSFDI